MPLRSVPIDSFALIADTNNHTIRRVDLASMAVTTLVGLAGSVGSDDGIGTAARFNHPTDVVISPDGASAYVADSDNHTIRRLDLATATVTTLAGSAGTPGSDDGTGAAAGFNRPRKLALTPDGTRLIVADTNNHTIRQLVIGSGAVTTVAGLAGVAGTVNGTGPASRFTAPADIAISPDGARAWIVQLNDRTVRQLNLTTFVVTTALGELRSGGPWDVDVSDDGRFALTVDSISAIMRFDLVTHQPTLLAGTTNGNQSGSTDGIGTAARFRYPYGIAISSDNSFALVADTGNQTIRRIDLATAAVTTIAGAAGQRGLINGIGMAARFNNPYKIVISPDRTFALVVEGRDHIIRRINLATLEVTTLAGTGVSGYQDGPGSLAQFRYPSGLAISPDQRFVFVADGNNVIRRIDLSTTVVSTIVGDPTYTEYGNIDGNLEDARFYGITDVDISGDGTILYVADEYNNTIRKIQLPQVIRDEWLPVTATNTLTLTHPLINPPLRDNPQARGALLLTTELYGPLPTTVITAGRQLLARSSRGFVIAPESYTVTLVADSATIAASRSAVLHGSVVNRTASTGVTLTVLLDGSRIRTLTLPTLLPGASTDFVLTLPPPTAGQHTYSVRTASGDTAAVTVMAVTPTLVSGAVAGPTDALLPGMTLQVAVPLTNTSPTAAVVMLDGAETTPVTVTLAPDEATVVGLPIHLPVNLPNGDHTVTITISGDLTAELHVIVPITGAAPPVVAPQWNPDAELPGAATAVQVTAPATAHAGEWITVTVALAPQRSGPVIVELTGFADMLQRAVLISDTQPLRVSFSLRVPGSLPGGSFSLRTTTGSGAPIMTPITVTNPPFQMTLQPIAGSVADGVVLPITVALTETANVTTTMRVAMRYGGQQGSQLVTLGPLATTQVTLPFTASLFASRATAFLSAPGDDQLGDAAYAPTIDSVPVTVRPPTAAWFDLPRQTLTAGTLITGQLHVTQPVTQVLVQLPRELGGPANLLAGTNVPSNIFPQTTIVSLTATTLPTSIPFALQIPTDAPRGRYTVDVWVDGLWQPVVIDVEGPEVIARVHAVAATTAPTVTLQLDIESATTVSVTPTVLFNGNPVTSTPAGPVTLTAGQQPLQLTAWLPVGDAAIGELTVEFRLPSGVVIGGATSYYDHAPGAVSDLTVLPLSGNSAAHSSVRTTQLMVRGSGAYTLTFDVDELTVVTQTLLLAGYQQLTVPVPLAGQPHTLIARLWQADGQQAAATSLLLTGVIPDVTPPTVSLEMIPSTLYTTTTAINLLVTGTVADTGSLCEVTVYGQAVAVDAAGDFTATLRLTPGMVTTTYPVRAVARDCAGNRTTTPAQAVTVTRRLPTVRFTTTQYLAISGVATVTLQISEAASITGTVDLVARNESGVEQRRQTTLIDAYAQRHAIVLTGVSGTWTVTLETPQSFVLGDPGTAVVSSTGAPTTTPMTTMTPTSTAIATGTPTPAAATATATVMLPGSPTATATRTSSPSPLPSTTPGQTHTPTATATTAGMTATATRTSSPLPLPSTTPTAIPTSTAIATGLPTPAGATATATVMLPGSPTATATRTSSSSPLPSTTPTARPTTTGQAHTPTATATTAGMTATATRTSSPLPLPSTTPTARPTTTNRDPYSSSDDQPYRHRKSKCHTVSTESYSDWPGDHTDGTTECPPNLSSNCAAINPIEASRNHDLR